MMLVQKPPNFPISLASAHNHNHHHRRHPSAPPVVVPHPTRTPGLLSLSMAKPSPSRHLQQQKPHRSPKTKPIGPHNRSPKPAPAEAQQPQASEAETPKEAQQPTPGPSPDKRGRQQAHSKSAAKDKIARRWFFTINPPLIDVKTVGHRSTSPPHFQSAQGRRNIFRQPSPPIQTTSQAEGPSFANNSQSNLFDPFIVTTDSDSDNNASRPAAAPAAKTAPSSRPTPKLANPSGKLARRRQHHIPSTPTPASSKAVAVPRPNNGRHTRAHSTMLNVSRSAPIISSPIMGAFPICDDMTDADGLTPPSTPTKRKDTTWQRTRQQAYNDGPHTAPLLSTSGFSFGPGGAGLPSPTTPSHRHRHHSRTPSEGVFNLSFDDDSSSDQANEELKMLFGMKPKRPGQGQNLRGMVHVSNSAHPGSSASKAAKAALYASSLFQNSPSPDELPPPAF
jgi:hypothetical protein